MYIEMETITTSPELQAPEPQAPEPQASDPSSTVRLWAGRVLTGLAAAIALVSGSSKTKGNGDGLH